MKKIISFLLTGSLAWTLVAQQKGPHVSFNKDVHNFGTIQEGGGKVSCKFSFVNTGSAPLIIKDVKASCGCTAPDYTKKPILPGKKGSISATFNPKNRPGHFSKTIHVSSNSINNQRKTLTIKGEVKPEEKNIAELYPQKMGPVRIRSNHMGFGSIKITGKQTEELGIVNISDQPVTIGFKEVPRQVRLVAEPEVLQPDQKGRIKGVYNAQKVDDWGSVIDKALIEVNGSASQNNRLTISANIKEDFSNLTKEELKNAPHIAFEESSYDFGKVSQNTKVKHQFVFTNTGKRKLILRKIDASCGCTVVKPEKKELSPGASSSLTVVFKTGNRSGHQNKMVTVISNDPENPVERLYLRGKVINEQE